MLQPALNNFLELNPGKKASGSCLKSSDDESETVVSHLFKNTEQTSFEEHLKLRESFWQSFPSSVIALCH